MGILRQAKSGLFAAALVVTALAASVGGCKNFEIADAESDSADADIPTVDFDASVPETPDTSTRVETAMRAVDKPIPDQNLEGLTDVAQIAAGCVIASVEVDLDVRHEWRGDVVVNLTSPAGTLVVLKLFVEADQVHDVVGTYPTSLIPAQTLTNLAGEEGMGNWTIVVADVDSEDLGTFETWAIRLLCQ